MVRDRRGCLLRVGIFDCMVVRDAMKQKLYTIWRWAKQLLCMAAVLLLIYNLAGVFYKPDTAQEYAGAQRTVDIQLPGESAKRAVTEQEIRGQLQEIGQLCTYCYEYTFAETAEHWREWLGDVRIPGTKNEISLAGKGIIKVGYDIDKIKTEIDNRAQTITITLPPAQIKDNYIINDSLVCEERNNLLNPIEFTQYHLIIEEIEQQALVQAEQEGVYALAEDHMKVLIENFVDRFGYAVTVIG